MRDYYDKHNRPPALSDKQVADFYARINWIRDTKPAASPKVAEFRAMLLRRRA